MGKDKIIDPTLTDEELAKARGRRWNDGYKAGYFDGYRAGQDAGAPDALPDEALILPTVQPDRGWAEHLGMPRLIATLRASRAEVEELEEVIKVAAQNHCGCINLYWEEDDTFGSRPKA
jgi:hypothetical protein